MTFKEFVASGAKFSLTGGPHDGQTVEPSQFSGWPSFVSLTDSATGRVARYAMRIGSLEHYDFDGTEEPTT